MQHSHMYLTAIIDWYSRMIVGWNLSDTLDTGYVIQAVKDAVAAHGTPAILNSDQGCQFTSNAYKTLLRELRIRQSMDGKSRWADHVMIERWNRLSNRKPMSTCYFIRFLTRCCLLLQECLAVKCRMMMRPHSGHLNRYTALLYLTFVKSF